MANAVLPADVAFALVDPKAYAECNYAITVIMSP
jgi:hypothetical protein